MDLSNVKYDANGLIVAIAQDVYSKEVLMQAFMNAEALQLTIDTEYAHYYSRSRQSLWKKGETSGHVQKVVSMTFDCDSDSILLQVEQTGVACHTGTYSCFTNEVKEEEKSAFSLHTLYDTITDRRDNPVEGSYTNYLFDKGVNKILKKVGEEASEIIIGSLNDTTENLIYEIGDLTYHLLVLMVEKGVSIEEVMKELKRRHAK